MLSLEGSWNDLPHASRRGRHAVLALMAVGFVACGGDGVSPPDPGSIAVATETSGFLKPDGYDLRVDGVSTGAIGANAEVTVADLEPGAYQVDLGEVPENCTAEPVTVTVEAGQTADASLVVTCTYSESASYTIQFNRERPNLDTGELTVCPFGICSTQDEWDLYVYNSLQSDPHSVIRQNEQAAIEIAHLPGVALEGLTEADLEGATFTTALVSDPFDAGRVILIRTDAGNVYALGNPTEDVTNGRLTFTAALIAAP